MLSVRADCPEMISPARPRRSGTDGRAITQRCGATEIAPADSVNLLLNGRPSGLPVRWTGRPRARPGPALAPAAGGGAASRLTWPVPPGMITVAGRDGRRAAIIAQVSSPRLHVDELMLARSEYGLCPSGSRRVQGAGERS